MKNPHNIAATIDREHDGYKVIVIDTDASHYYGTPWKQLGSFGKRKFENLAMAGLGKTRIIYKT